MSRSTASSAGCVLTASRSSRLRRSAASVSAATPGRSAVRRRARSSSSARRKTFTSASRHDDGADVAALDHGVAPDREGALALAHHLAHLGVARDDRHEPVDLGIPDRGRDVLAVHLDAPVEAERDRVRDARARRAPRRPRGRRRRGARSRSAPGTSRPCRGSGTRAAARASTRPCSSRAGGPVDGHDHVAGG